MSDGLQQNSLVNRGEQTVEYSRTEQVHIVLPKDVNGTFQLFGGQLMQWVDVVAAVVARRHCDGLVITAAIDHLEFLAPASLNDTVVLMGRMTYAGHTSMEVCVETFVEPLQGNRERKLVNRAYLTMVALDQNHKPRMVPHLKVVTEQEQADYEAAKMRRADRKRTRGA